MNLPQRPQFPRLVIFGGITLALAVTGIYAAYQKWGAQEAWNIGKLVAVLLIVLVAVLLIAWLIWKLMLWMRESKARKQEAQPAPPPPGATPEERAELEALQERVTTAVRMIRESRIAKSRGAEEASTRCPG